MSVLSRPLFLAGAGAVAGVLVAAAGSPAGIVPAVGLLTTAALLRSPGAGVLGLALLAGTLAGERIHRRAERILEQSAAAWPRAPPRPATFVLRIDACTEDPDGRRSWLEGRDAEGRGLLCSWPGAAPETLVPGARVEVTGLFRRPSAPGNPGERDLRRALALRGIGLLGDLRRSDNIVLVEAAPAGPGPWLARLRRTAGRRLAGSLPPDVAPLAVAVLLGIRAGIDARDRSLFERTGTLHLLAISGLHVLLLAGALHGLLRRLGTGPRLAAGITLLLALLYVPVTGAAPPIRRAVTMLVLYGFALVRGRLPDAATALGGAALLLALGDPAEVYRPGFRLSFAAAGGIALLAPPWRERWGRRHRLLARFPAVRADRPLRLMLASHLLRGLPVSLAAWLATQGLVLHEFGALTPWAPLVNLAVAPAVALILPLVALVACGVGVLAAPAEGAMRLLYAALERLARLPLAYRILPPPAVPALGLWCLGVALLRRSAGAGIALLTVAAGVTLLAGSAPDEPELVLLDVGHGQALIVRGTGGEVVLVDAGSLSRREIGRRVVLPALRTLGVRRLDLVVCTHSDADHGNALPAVLDALPVGAFVVGRRPSSHLVRAASRNSVRVHRARGGELLLASGGIRLMVLSGAEAAASCPNESALALLVELNGRRVLLPSDREAEGLRELAAAGLPACEVLLAPHHGAACEEAGRLRALVLPRELLVSCAARRAHAPTLRAYGCRRCWRTDRDGALQVGFPRRGPLRVRAWRLRPWRVSRGP